MINRKTGCTIAAHSLARAILDDFAGFANILGKAFAIKGKNTGVIIAVARQFVASIGNSADHLRMALGDPSQGEKGRTDSRLGNQIKNGINIVLDPCCDRIPVIAVDYVFKRADLKLVFKIDRHAIDYSIIACNRDRLHSHAQAALRAMSPSSHSISIDKTWRSDCSCSSNRASICESDCITAGSSVARS